MYLTARIRFPTPKIALGTRKDRLATFAYGIGIGLLLSLSMQNPSLFAQQTQNENLSQSSNDLDVAKIKQMILQLGHSDFALRNSAEEELEKLGSTAIQPLRNALTGKNSDNEIRLRSRRLLILIERRAKEQKTTDFLNGTGNTVDFVGWNEFSSITGDDKNARKLFMQLHESQPKLLKTAFSKDAPNLKTLEEKFQVFARSLYLSTNGNASKIIPNLSAAMFIAGNQFQTGSKQSQSIKLSEESYQRIFTALAKPQMVATVENSPGEKPIISLLSNWLKSTPDDSTKLMANKILTIQNYKLKSCAHMILDIAATKVAPVRIRASALEAISQIGQLEHSQKLEELFEDNTTVGNFLPIRSKANAQDSISNKDLMEVQIRDLALATVILLHKKDIKQFGFLPTANENKRLLFSQAGFTSNDLRNQAFEKWSRSDKK